MRRGAGVKKSGTGEGDDADLRALVRAIAVLDELRVTSLLAGSPGLATQALRAGATREAPRESFIVELGHYVYAGDTALHVAAVAYSARIAEALIALGADVRAKNRRGAEPLHYAVDGGPTGRRWNPRAQARVIACLLSAGADPNATDKGGVTPLHRAVRNRCAAAVEALLTGGADASRKNNAGSTPMTLANVTSGRGGSGTPEAKAEQQKIVSLLEGFGRERREPPSRHARQGRRQGE